MAIDFALYEYFAKTTVNLTNIELQVPNAADPNEYLSCDVAKVKVWNERYYKKRIFNKNKIEIFPFKEVDTEAWIVELMGARLFYRHKRGLSDYMRIPVTKKFNLRVKHELPKKLPELGLIYNIVDDILDFPPDLQEEYMKLNYEDTKVDITSHTKEQSDLYRNIL